MPITIKTANMKYKNSEGEYVGVNAISDNTTAEQLARIEDKGDEVIASIPSDYTALETQVNNIEGMIASEFSTSTAYAVGDLVIYNDHYYRFKIAHPAGAWNASHVDQTTVSGEIISNVTDLKNSLEKALSFVSVNQNSASTIYSNLASNLQGNTYSYVLGAWFNDLPTSGNQVYWLYTVANKTSSFNYSMQIAVNPQLKEIYIRYWSNGSYTNWVLLYSLNTSISQKTLTAGDDWNDVVDKGFYYVTEPNTYQNTPSSSGGYLFVIISGSIVIQDFTDIGGGHYIRFKNSNGWKDWVTISGHDDGSAYYAFGDSLTKGRIGADSETVTYTNYAYPKLTGKLLKMKVHNYAVGGQGIVKDWDYIQTNYINGLDMSDAKLITLSWVGNDFPDRANINFGSYTDTTLDTYMGYHFTIMKQFQEKCPYAQIIFITGYGYSNGTRNPYVKPDLIEQFTHVYTWKDKSISFYDMYEEIEKLCNLHGWPCVNQAKGCSINQFNCQTLIGDNIHPTDEGYKVYSNHIAARVASFFANV